jgi:hypothetical protein
MSTARIAFSVVILFVAVWLTDVLIHAVLLGADYKATKELWRSEAELMTYLPWTWLGQLFAAISMTLLYARGFARRRCLGEACLFGFLMALMGQAFVPTFYLVQPLPGLLCVKWMVLGAIQGVLLGLVLYAVCRPKTEPAAGG